MTAHQTTFLTDSAAVAPFVDSELARRARPAPDATPAPAAATLEGAPLDVLLEVYTDAGAYLDRIMPSVNEAHALRQQLLDLIRARMNEAGARKYMGANCVCRYEVRKSGSAAIPLPAGLRAELVATAMIPASDIDDALPMIVPPPTCKPDLRRVRKLAEYGDTVADIIDRHIVEARRVEVLVVEPLELNVTPAALS